MVAAFDGGGLPPAVWDVRVLSRLALLEALERLLKERGYVPGRELPRPAGAASGSGSSEAELRGEKDWPKRDWPYLVFGVALLPTILLTTLGIRFMKQSWYTFRTVVSIGVEGNPRPVPDPDSSQADIGARDVAGEVRVRLQVAAGRARDEGGIWRPTDDEGEVARLSAERRQLEQGISELLRSMDVS